jgi:hypothetical protein
MKNLLNKLVVIHTVTNFYSGRLDSVTDGYIELSSASWIADTGRATAFYADPTSAAEVEVFKQPIYIAVGAVIIAYEVTAIPTEQTN